MAQMTATMTVSIRSDEPMKACVAALKVCNRVLKALPRSKKEEREKLERSAMRAAKRLQCGMQLITSSGRKL